MRAKWRSLDTLKWALTTLMIPITLFFLNQSYQKEQTKRQEDASRQQNERQTADARLRLYTELLSKREEADTGLRKGIFDKVLDIYLKQAKDIDEKVVALELLTLNFNDSLDLSPLFWQIFREIQTETQVARRSTLMKRLTRVSNYIKARQIDLLDNFGDKEDGYLLIDVLGGKAGSFKMEKPIDKELTFDDPDASDPRERRQKRHFRLYPLEFDQENRRVYCSVEHAKPDGQIAKSAFWVDEYDFPLATFSRISKSERFALVLREFKPPYVGFTLIYFPSSRSGVKDKPFIDEVISNLTTRDEQK